MQRWTERASSPCTIILYHHVTLKKHRNRGRERQAGQHDSASLSPAVVGNHGVGPTGEWVSIRSPCPHIVVFFKHIYNWTLSLKNVLKAWNRPNPWLRLFRSADFSQYLQHTKNCSRSKISKYLQIRAGEAAPCFSSHCHGSLEKHSWTFSSP